MGILFEGNGSRILLVLNTIYIKYVRIQIKKECYV